MKASTPWSAEPRSAPDRGLALLAFRPVTAGVRPSIFNEGLTCHSTCKS